MQCKRKRLAVQGCRILPHYIQIGEKPILVDVESVVVGTLRSQVDGYSAMFLLHATIVDCASDFLFQLVARNNPVDETVL